MERTLTGMLFCVTVATTTGTLDGACAEAFFSPPEQPESTALNAASASNEKWRRNLMIYLTLRSSIFVFFNLDLAELPFADRLGGVISSPGSRNSAFHLMDAPGLLPLAESPRFSSNKPASQISASALLTSWTSKSRDLLPPKISWMRKW